MSITASGDHSVHGDVHHLVCGYPFCDNPVMLFPPTADMFTPETDVCMFVQSDMCHQTDVSKSQTPSHDVNITVNEIEISFIFIF